MARYTIDTTREEIDFSRSGYVGRVLQNCKNLLLARKGEIPYDRLRGLDPALFHLSAAKLNEALLPEIDRALAWEPNAEAVSARAYRGADNELIISVTVEIDERI